ncbi:ATP-binding protein, partial [Phocaeicola vulgatus]|uniref:ATP-binding protein n=1 Tax=Phocaeicola vulgatus TaxID=821 RepID=UPI00210CF2A9
SLLDKGRAIPMELQEKIFVAFFTRHTEGPVIGLSLCRQIIKRHVGNFYLQESRQGKTKYDIERPEASFILK